MNCGSGRIPGYGEGPPHWGLKTYGAKSPSWCQLRASSATVLEPCDRALLSTTRHLNSSVHFSFNPVAAFCCPVALLRALASSVPPRISRSVGLLHRPCHRMTEHRKTRVCFSLRAPLSGSMLEFCHPHRAQDPNNSIKFRILPTPYS